MDPHTLQALDGAAHVSVYALRPGVASVYLQAKESPIPSAEASLSLSVHGARALAQMLMDAAERAEIAQ